MKSSTMFAVGWPMLMTTREYHGNTSKRLHDVGPISIHKSVEFQHQSIVLARTPETVLSMFQSMDRGKFTSTLMLNSLASFVMKGTTTNKKLREDRRFVDLICDAQPVSNIKNPDDAVRNLLALSVLEITKPQLIKPYLTVVRERSDELSVGALVRGVNAIADLKRLRVADTESTAGKLLLACAYEIPHMSAPEVSSVCFASSVHHSKRLHFRRETKGSANSLDEVNDLLFSAAIKHIMHQLNTVENKRSNPDVSELDPSSRWTPDLMCSFIVSRSRAGYRDENICETLSPHIMKALDKERSDELNNEEKLGIAWAGVVLNVHRYTLEGFVKAEILPLALTQSELCVERPTYTSERDGTFLWTDRELEQILWIVKKLRIEMPWAKISRV
eukprot:CFRG1321T1